ncbi:hypothetical protein [Alicycliphilus denitrificans]|nr:hypothetical protein [Alicycliphilus denitrificans]ADU99819.1 formate/nitrate transporter [Alicycliphilus denitrificans BC]HRP19393.1 hypothetical protein [Alicycliphilus sp.]
MKTLDAAFALLRLAAIAIGYVVILMWLAGELGWADFRLIFILPEMSA